MWGWCSFYWLTLLFFRILFLFKISMKHVPTIINNLKIGRKLGGFSFKYVKTCVNGYWRKIIWNERKIIFMPNSTYLYLTSLEVGLFSGSNVNIFLIKSLALSETQSGITNSAFTIFLYRSLSFSPKKGGLNLRVINKFSFDF